MIISEQFLKSIPLGYKNNIFSKLIKFEKQLLECENRIRELPAGYWVRRVKNTLVFKFRLNNKDRILFTYIKKRGEEKNLGSDILFLSYVNHDEQIRVSNAINIKNIDIKDIEINNENYIEDNIDKDIETSIHKQFSKGIVNINEIPALVVDAEDFEILVSELNDDYLYYLSDEQYNVIKSIDNPILLSGAAGSGKTAVLINTLALAKKNSEEALYISFNKLLVENTKDIYTKFVNKMQDDLECDFYSLNDIEKNILNLNEDQIANYRDIFKWTKEKVHKYKYLKNKDLYEIITEIRGVLKGYLGLEYSEIMELKEKNSGKLSLEKYLNIPKQYSSLDENEKRNLYQLSEEYDNWLIDNKLLDNNDVARKIILNNCFKTYDWVIVDEVQDLSEVEIYMLSKFVKEGGHIIWVGDINQTINPTFFNYGRIKNLYYIYNDKLNDFYLEKSYRSTKEIIGLINDITNLKMELIGKSKYDTFTTSIKEGSSPVILKFKEKQIKALINDVKDKHYCAIVVANEEAKQKLIEEFPEIIGRVFIVHEIKGLEYENIICYNILSSYTEIWKSILNGDYKHNDKMRYYFNLLYVAISRAKERLNIYEKNIEVIDFKPFNKYNILEKYDDLVIGTSKTSTQNDWKNEADRLEKNGQTEKAEFIRNYKLEKMLSEVNKVADHIYQEIYKDVSKEINIENDLDEEMSEGIIKYRQRNYTAALDIFNKLIEKYPMEDKLYYYIANVYSYMTGGKEYCIKYYKKAIELNPSRYEYYLDMCALLKTLNRYDDAIKILECLDKIFPNLGNSKKMQADIYYNMNKFEKARSLLIQSNNYPKYIFNSSNKVWVEPKLIEKVEHKNVKEKEFSNIKLPYGIEYLNLLDNGQFDGCINEVEFLDSSYNKKNKRFLIKFDLELCSICENFEKCIASKADKKNIVSIKQATIKQLMNRKNKENRKYIKYNNEMTDKEKKSYARNVIKEIECESRFNYDTGKTSDEFIIKDIM